MIRKTTKKELREEFERLIRHRQRKVDSAMTPEAKVTAQRWLEIAQTALRTLEEP